MLRDRDFKIGGLSREGVKKAALHQWIEKKKRNGQRQKVKQVTDREIYPKEAEGRNMESTNFKNHAYRYAIVSKFVVVVTIAFRQILFVTNNARTKLSVTIIKVKNSPNKSK